MAESTEIVIGDPRAQHVLIRALSRSHPVLFDAWDGNRIDCEVEITAGAFQGRFAAELRSEEFLAFLSQIEELSRTLEGVASLATMEGQIAIALNGNDKGHVRVVGEAVDVPGTGNRLEFGFDAEQTLLPEIIRSLKVLLAVFPVLGAPEA